MKLKWIVSGLVLALLSSTVQAQFRFREDAWRDHIGGAMAASSPGISKANMGPNRDQSATQNAVARGKCITGAERTLPADDRSPAPVLTIGFDSRCNYEGAVVLVVWEPTGPNSHNTRTTWVLSADTVGIQTMGPTFGVSSATWMQEVDSVLEKAISLDPFPASKLPVWPQGEVIPTLPAGLTWNESAERDLYEAIRRGAYPVYCTYAWQVTCAADVPSRPGRMVPILTISNLSENYQPQNAKAALAILTGDTPQLTPTQLVAAQTREADKRKQITEQMMRAMERVLPKEK